ncbi:unnamed protein product [Clavelina lepadiformis]|uniref:Uncharacterized protein n=1 Tax=Clavelina lepadiformis TaxID=159417 RepID=A0ABP0FJA2_CLALP
MVKYNKATRAVLSDQHPRQVLFLTAHTTTAMKATFFSPAHLSRLKPIRETNRKQDTPMDTLTARHFAAGDCSGQRFAFRVVPP